MVLRTKTVQIGRLKVGNKNPVRIQAMLKTPTADIKNLIKEAKCLQREGAEVIRMAVREKKDVQLLPLLREHISLPLIADIHFHYQLALLAIKEGFEAIRLNPLNIYKKKEVKEIAQMARDYAIPLRVGINSGGFKKRFLKPETLAHKMLRSCQDYLGILERENFFDIMVSLKGSDISSTIIANRLFAKKFNYPLHIGITASGPFLEGLIKSSAGLGVLLYEKIGDIIRVSLTAPSFWEVRAARYLLQALNIRHFGPEIISCPTCSRCEVNLVRIVNRCKEEFRRINFRRSLRIAIMGCVVNGPGEAYQADIGAAFGGKKAVIFKKGKILKQTSEDKVIKDLIMLLG